MRCEGWKRRCAVWMMRCAVWKMLRYAVWKMRYVVWKMLYAVWKMRCEDWKMRCAIWKMRCEVWKMRCAVWKMQCAVWKMRRVWLPNGHRSRRQYRVFLAHISDWHVDSNHQNTRYCGETNLMMMSSLEIYFAFNILNISFSIACFIA